MKIKGIFIFVMVIILLSGCCSFANNEKGKIVAFDDLCSYIEVSLEKENYLTFRAVYLAYKSYIVITSYNFYKSETNENLYFLSYYESTPDKKCPTEMEYKKWGGIQLTIPKGVFDPTIDKVYYKDSKGEYEILLGSKDSWKTYLEKKLETDVKKYNYPESVIKEIKQSLENI